VSPWLWFSFVSTVFAQFAQMLALSLGFTLTTSLPTGGASALFQPLLGIAVLAVGLKIPGLMGGGLAGGNLVGDVLGMAGSAAMGAGVSRSVGRAFVGGRAGASGAAAPNATASGAASATVTDGQWREVETTSGLAAGADRALGSPRQPGSWSPASPPAWWARASAAGRCGSACSRCWRPRCRWPWKSYARRRTRAILPAYPLPRGSGA
jgi:hypothetical protein